MPISLTPDATGKANLSWVATSADTKAPKCGHANNVSLADSGTVSVHADSECSA